MHGWESPGPKESDRPDSVPLHPNVASKIALLTRPAEGTYKYDKKIKNVNILCPISLLDLSSRPRHCTLARAEN
jgi:hypothetical protein